MKMIQKDDELTRYKERLAGMNAFELALEVHGPTGLGKRLTEYRKALKTQPEFSYKMKTTYTDYVWEGTPLNTVRNLSSIKKGDFGEQLVEHYLVESGRSIERIPFGGDFVDSRNVQSEVKTAFAQYPTDGDVTYVTAWWNQIRANYSNIRWYYFVLVRPDGVDIFKLDRNKVNLLDLPEGHSGGSDGIKSLQLYKRSGMNYYWCQKLGMKFTPVKTYDIEEIGIDTCEYGEEG